MKILLLCSVIVVVVCAQSILATKYHTVGDADGWGPDVDYSAWAKHKTFHRGDVLVFQYQEGYGVQEVRRNEYKKCDGSKALYSGNNGRTSIPLKTVGTHFFICADFNMCSYGMNITLNVLP